MITKEQALEIALDHLTDGLRRRLRVSAGWPAEAPREHNLYRDQHMLQDIPEALRNSNARRPGAPEPPATALPVERETSPRPVWRVYVPGERLAVGASRFIVIDEETGEVVADGRYGE